MNTFNDIMLMKQNEIENDDISSHWLKIHYYIIIVLISITFVLEVVMFFVLSAYDLMDMSLRNFLHKCMFIPSVLNFSIFGLCFLVNKSKLSLSVKCNVFTLVLTFICFVISFVHDHFTGINFIFAVPLFISIVYGNKRLCIKTFIFSVILKFISTQFIDLHQSKQFSDYFLFNNLLECFFLFCLFALALLMIHFQQTKQIKAVQDNLERNHLRKAVRYDVLTNVYNRYALRTYFDSLKFRDGKIHMVLVDIDDFKEINDTYGHIIGDKVLVRLGEILLTCNELMIPFRLGGDEFCLLFERMELREVLQQCNHIRWDYEQWMKERMQLEPYTLSMGIAEYDGTMSLIELVDCADKALYQSKHNGKNQISLFSQQVEKR